VSTHILHRRDTAANWTSVNPVLYAGELGLEEDTGKFKWGDGVTAWASLDYVATGGPSGGGGDGTTDPEIVRDTMADALQQSGAITITEDDAGETIIVGVRTASETDTGVLKLATTAATTTGTDSTSAVHPAGLKVELDKKSVKASSEIVVFHDGTPTGPTRPTGYARVRWINPVGTSYEQPSNMAAGDVWEDQPA
jgi:hypothetical protein